MDSLLNWIGIGSAALLAVAIAVAWLEHRARLGDLRRELETAENSRFMLEEHMRDVDERLRALNVALESQHKPHGGTQEASAHKSTSDAALQRIAARAASEGEIEAPTSPPSGWIDTLPMVQSTEPKPSLGPTRPADLHPH